MGYVIYNINLLNLLIEQIIIVKVLDPNKPFRTLGPFENYKENAVLWIQLYLLFNFPKVPIN